MRERDKNTSSKSGVSNSSGSIFHNDMPVNRSYKSSDIYNKEKLDRESRERVLELKRLQDGLRGVKIRTCSDEDARQHHSWTQTQEDTWAVADYLASLDEPYAASVESSMTGKKPLTVGEFCRYQVLGVGGCLIIRENLSREMRYAQRVGVADIIKPYIDLQKFTLGASALDIKINGVSWADVLDIAQRNDGTALQYKFLVDAMILLLKMSHQSIFEENNKGLFGQYPNTAKHMIEGSAILIKAGILSSPDVVDSEIFNNSGVAKKVAQRGKEFLLRVGNIREKTYNNVFNPNSPEFPCLKDTLSFYLKQGFNERYLALSVLGIDKYDFAVWAYRAAKNFQKQGIEESFYESLAGFIEEYLNYEPTDKTILREGDAGDILDETQTGDFSPVEIESSSLGLIISSIFSKQSHRVFADINPLIIDSTGLIKPQAIAVVFDQNRPQKFAVFLDWENDLGESTEVNLYFDTKKNLFDWNFLKSPNDEEMGVIRVAMLKATRAILLSIQRQALTDYQNKKERNSSLAPHEVKPKQRREQVTDEIYTLRRQIKRDNAEKTQNNRQIDPRGADMPRTQEATVKKQILLPEKDRLRGLLEGIDFSKRDNVERAIDRFNNEGVGQFTRKHARGNNGEILYTLRVGNIRVLVYETESLEGIRQFVIKDIDYRSNVYRRNKM
ncbi:hypothetical protein M1615_01395 [Patescibacteria group bacterium]|nr:hypothetical protein [Patescibacteria group bacterium]MCL5010243.1 hypothetical protein [Patescibacteria group bacterium]